MRDFQLNDEHDPEPFGKSVDFAAVLQRCEGAFARETLRGYTADLRIFGAWCSRTGRTGLPASSGSVAAFIDAESLAVAPSTLKRRLCAIKFAHRYADLPDPTAASHVQLALKRAARRKPRRPEQVRGLNIDTLHAILAACPETVAGARDAALISIGYDTLCRSCELAAMRVEHLRPDGRENTSILIPRSKGDQAGDGRIAWLSPRSVDLIAAWQAASDISEGPLFRALHLRRAADHALDTCSVRRLVKRAAQRAPIERELANNLSGHSMRVGAAQDMMVAGFDALAIMQAGGWRTPNVLLRYVEKASMQGVHAKRWAALGG
jgi:integrase/recombinase XerD